MLLATINAKKAKAPHRRRWTGADRGAGARCRRALERFSPRTGRAHVAQDHRVEPTPGETVDGPARCPRPVLRTRPMRALLPALVDGVDPLEVYSELIAPPPSDRPYVRVNMISSLDGAIAVAGRSGALGGPADGRVFSVLRSLADVVLVGAGTVRAEGYGPVRLDEELRDARRRRRQPPVPPIAVVTRSCHLDWSAPFFAEAEARPIVLTVTGADEGCRRRAARVAEVVVVGDEAVDVARAVQALAERGAWSILGEGGPALNGQLAVRRLLDELCLTLSPKLVGGGDARVIGGPSLPWPLDVRVTRVLEEDGFLFLRLGCC